jgi:hypothetical protein
MTQEESRNLHRYINQEILSKKSSINMGPIQKD